MSNMVSGLYPLFFRSSILSNILISTFILFKLIFDMIKYHLLMKAITTSPPTVSDTKRIFYANYKKLLLPMYNTPIQNMLVKQHIHRYNKNYTYSDVSALGIVTALDSILNTFPDDEKTSIKNAFIISLNEDPEMYYSNIETLKPYAKSSHLGPNKHGNTLQKSLYDIASNDKYVYSSFAAIGIFKLLQMNKNYTGNSVKHLSESVGFKGEIVHKDIATFFSLLKYIESSQKLADDIREESLKKSKSS
ncbi:hypothetical protein NY2A_b184R [Paramecium bursaria Chlorella virus NY2A]|uniref:Uncharacterized protein b184R n=1 Tax=Paramecium bursaria Chlorella virus NY2A TaxID=46021 RepID=A7IW59_PBCVN|nr:hypothetical protein NY2A_b184R [Paramecium bursaria Chlorella virus NY2A]ABT14583.1 hypothetical protein NY2A_b184R [Paramecium bursaria Chlorella virus NY2A]